jgi:hypothetical protein
LALITNFAVAVDVVVVASLLDFYGHLEIYGRVIIIVIYYVIIIFVDGDSDGHVIEIYRADYATMRQ